ncbi:MAG: protein kinase [Lentisphaeria bacterium]|nr:protein kinase [Lentisphaeria bacterium]
MKLFCKKCNKVFTADSQDSPVVNCPVCSAEISRPEEELSAGVVIGDFVIEKSINKGGMGEVFLATQISLDRPVALKVLQSEFTNDQEYIDSLFREARAAARINHPNIVQAYAVGNDDGHYYLAMELVTGDTLKQILRDKGAISPLRSAEIILDIAKALDTAWREQKLVHQDIKPDNIMINANGVAKLADLGLAKTATVKEQVLESADEVLGTPQYISPEQLTGVATDVRSDIYSLGATFYHIVTGKLPYRATDMMELAQMHNSGNLVPPKEIKEDLPDQINRIIIKMMARNIEQRYQSAADLAADLKKFIDSEKNKPALSEEKDDTQAGKTMPQVSAPQVPKIPVVKGPKIAVAPTITLQNNPAAQPKPSVPSKPVMPPKPSVPAPPVSNPVSQPNQNATPAPVPPPVSEKSNNKKEKNSGNIKKIVIISAITAAAVILLTAIAGGVLFYLEKSETIPQLITPYVAKVIPAAASQEKAEESKENTPVVAEEKIPENLPTAAATLEKFEVTGRAEYFASFKEISEFRRQNPEASKELLAKIDAAWNKLSMPVFPKEKEALLQLKTMFSALDESNRCVSERESLRQKHISLLNIAVREEAERKKREEIALEEQKKKQQELERQAQENANQRRENEEREKARLSELTADINKRLSRCVCLMREYLLTGEKKDFAETLQEAQTFAKTASKSTVQERKLINQFQNDLTALNRELKNLGDNFDKFRKINRRSGIRMRIKGKSIPLDRMEPGKIFYNSADRYREVYLDYDKLSPEIRRDIFIRLGNIKNAEFYCDLFHRKRPADATVPAGFWKRVWPIVKNSL